MSDPPGTTIEIRVYYEDTDFSGRVYHASYLRFLERGRTEWLRRLGLEHGELAAISGVSFVVRSLQIEYLTPALIDDLLTVETRISALRGASIEFDQRIFRGDRQLIAANVVVAALRDDRPARIPDALRRVLQHAIEEPGDDQEACELKARSKRVARESRRSPNRTSRA